MCNFVSEHNMNAKDPVGHGAHVCGSVCVSSIYTIPVLEKDISVKGTAPAAKLMMQAMSKYSDSRNKLDNRSTCGVVYTLLGSL